MWSADLSLVSLLEKRARHNRSPLTVAAGERGRFD